MITYVLLAWFIGYLILPPSQNDLVGMNFLSQSDLGMTWKKGPRNKVFIPLEKLHVRSLINLNWIDAIAKFFLHNLHHYFIK